MASFMARCRRRSAVMSLAALCGLAVAGRYSLSFVTPAPHPPVRPFPVGAAGLSLDSTAAPAGAGPAVGGLAAAGALALAGVGAVAAARRQRRQSATSRQSSPVIVAAEAGEWMPRTTGWTEQELVAERQRAATMEEPAGYAGPRYTGPASVTDAFIEALIGMQEKGTIMPKKDLYLMVLDVISVLRKEGSLQDVSIPPGQTLTVVGDLHGQYWDFMNILKMAGKPSPSSPFIFNGDFVDRGSWSIEVITVLFAFKLKDPSFVFLNRGNHEMLETNILYGFCGETISKYDTGLFDLFSEAFRNLPLAHLVENKVMVMHAGLPGPDPRIWMPGQTHDPTDAIPMTEARLPKLADIRAVDRYMEITPNSYPDSIGPTSSDKEVNDMRILIDILWGDPRGGPGYGPSYRKGKGVYMFGPDVTETFCKQNNLQCIVRSHEVKAAGYRWDHPQLLSVFSAPNYLDTGNNQGAFLRLTTKGPGTPVEIEPVSYSCVPHPDLPPMHWQETIFNEYPHLTRKMKKKGQDASFDEFGDSDFEGLMNFDEWEPDEAEQFQEAFKVDQYGRELKDTDGPDWAYGRS